MEDLITWNAPFVARCPVTLFEAPLGSSVWHLSNAIGELNVLPRGNSVVTFQLHDLLDNQVLYEHTVRKAASYDAKSERFHTVRQENGSYKGFGFSEKAAASEFVLQLERVLVGIMRVAPAISADRGILAPSATTQTNHSRTASAPLSGFKRGLSLKGLRFGDAPAPSTSESSSPGTPSPEASPASVITSYRSVPRRLRSAKSDKKGPQLPSPLASTIPGPSQQQSSLAGPSSVAKGSTSLPAKVKGWDRVRRKFLSTGKQAVEEGPEIGYPFNVKHVGHIGWTPPATSENSWMDNVPTSDFTQTPLCNFGSSKAAEFLLEASAAARWNASLKCTALVNYTPPPPPMEYMDTTINSLSTDLRSSPEPSPSTVKLKKSFSLGRRKQNQ